MHSFLLCVVTESQVQNTFQELVQAIGVHVQL